MRPRLLVATVFAACVAVACGGASRNAESATAGLPAYTPDESRLFGDVLAPEIFDRPATSESEQDAERLAPRAQRADAVLRVSVVTVSEERLAGNLGYTLTVRVDPPALAGTAPAPTLDLTIGPSSPSLSQVKTAGSSLTGRRFILFVKRYAEAGEPTLRWHGEADRPAVAEGIRRALDGARSRPQTDR